MKRGIFIVAASAVMAFAAATPALAGDRLNLWPILYSDGTEFSALWPVVSVTGDHFAVRPIYSHYWNRNGGERNFMWPICQFNGDGNNRIFPFYWGENYFALAPAFGYWHGKSDRRDYLLSVAALYWHLGDEDSFLSTLFPLYLWLEEGNGKDKSAWAAAGLAGFKTRDHRLKCSWLHPLWYWNRETVATLAYFDYHSESTRIRSIPPLLAAHVDDERKKGLFSPYFSKWVTKCDGASHGRVFMGLAGWDAPVGGDCTFWSVPFIYRDANSLVSPLWLSGREDGSSWQIVPPLLSGVFSDEKTGERRWRFLLGLAGVNSGVEGVSESWCYPLYYSGKGMFVTPLYGQTETSKWLFPIWYGDGKTFVSLPWCEKRDAQGELEWGMCPPLLSSFSRDPAKGESKLKLLLGLAGGTKGADGIESSWMLPFYYHDRETTMVTPLCGRSGDARWLAPLFYTRQDRFVSPLWCSRIYPKTGASEWCMPLLLTFGSNDGKGEREFMMFPFFGLNTRGEFMSLPYCHLFSRKFKEDVKLMDADVLPERVKIWEEPVTNKIGEVHPVIKGDHIYGSNTFTFMLLCDNDRYLSGYLEKQPHARKEHNDPKSLVEGTNYVLRLTKKAGNLLLWNRQERRTVRFSAQTRQKVESTRVKDSSLLLFLYNSHSEKDDMTGDESSKDSILWRLWRREKKGGNVSVDAFPGFTYDSRKDGYSKTSLLWRLFRYEKDPEKGTSVDLFFIPVWR